MDFVLGSLAFVQIWMFFAVWSRGAPSSIAGFVRIASWLALGRRSVRYNRFWTIDGEPCVRSDLTTITVLADDGSDPDLTQASRIESKAFLRYEAWVILQVGNRVPCFLHQRSGTQSIKESDKKQFVA